MRPLTPGMKRLYDLLCENDGVVSTKVVKVQKLSKFVGHLRARGLADWADRNSNHVATTVRRLPNRGWCSGHGEVDLFRNNCRKCLERDFPDGIYPNG